MASRPSASLPLNFWSGPKIDPPWPQSQAVQVALQAVVAGLHLARRAVDVRALGLLDRLGVGQELVHGGRHLQAELVIDVLAVHVDEDRNVVGNADHDAVVHRDAVDQRAEEVVEVVVRHCQVRLGGILLARIEHVAREARHPALIQIVEVVGAEAGGDIERQLLEHLFQRQNLDLHIDARGFLEEGLQMLVDRV